MKPTTAKIYGAIGMLSLQISTIPALWQAIRTGETAPLSSLLLITAGMICCIIQEVQAKLWAYVIGSTVSVIGHVAIILVVIYR